MVLPKQLSMAQMCLSIDWKLVTLLLLLVSLLFTLLAAFFFFDRKKFLQYGAIPSVAMYCNLKNVGFACLFFSVLSLGSNIVFILVCYGK